MTDDLIQYEDDSRELTDIEKLVIAQAFFKEVAKLVDTKSMDNLRASVDGYFRDLFAQTGAKSFDVHLFGAKVGTYSLTISKPTPQKTTQELEVRNHMEFLKWAELGGFMVVDMDAVMEHFKESGEVPDGCSVVNVVTPADPGGKVTRSTFKVDVDSVIEALGGYLPEASRQLLEGEFE